MPLVIRIAVIATVCFIVLLLFYAALGIVNYYKRKRNQKREEIRKNNSDCYIILKEILTYDEGQGKWINQDLSNNTTLISSIVEKLTAPENISKIAPILCFCKPTKIGKRLFWMMVLVKMKKPQFKI